MEQQPAPLFRSPAAACMQRVPAGLFPLSPYGSLRRAALWRTASCWCTWRCPRVCVSGRPPANCQLHGAPAPALANTWPPRLGAWACQPWRAPWRLHARASACCPCPCCPQQRRPAPCCFALSPAAPFSFELEGRVAGTTAVVLTTSGTGRTDPDDVNQARRCMGAACWTVRHQLTRRRPWRPERRGQPGARPGGRSRATACNTLASDAPLVPTLACRRSSLSLPPALCWAPSTSSAPAPATRW